MIDPKVYDLVEDLLESMNDSIIVDKDETIIFFSESYARDANINASDVIGKKVRDVILNTRLHKILETGEEEIADGISAKIKTEKSINLTSSTPFHICNRIPIRKAGEKSGDILGAFAYTALANETQFKKMNEQIQLMRNHEKMLAQHLNETYRPEYLIDSIVGSSPAIRQLKETIIRFAPSDVTVSITGETGTGKELIAGAIHGLSNRSDNAFIKINCASIPENLLESELFGYEPGSFTGALKTGKIGKFELANGGTLLLDEIGELPLPLQAKLLRVLQEKEIERIGGKKPIPLDVRVICSTNRDLRQLVNNGLFREDLYYRINVMEIIAPPLRDRIDDLSELCSTFIDAQRKKGYGNVTGVDPSVYSLLKDYSWPGNVRELEHVIECACLMARGSILTVSDFDFLSRRILNDNYPEDSIKSTVPAAEFGTDNTYSAPNTFENISYDKEQSTGSSLTELTMTVERNAIINAMEKSHYRVSDAAKYLNTNRSSLYRKLRQYKIFPYNN